MTKYSLPGMNMAIQFSQHIKFLIVICVYFIFLTVIINLHDG